MSKLYNILFIFLFSIIKPLVKFVLPKFKQREDYIKQNPIKPLLDSQKKTIWFHAASMGEFEQAKPVIEKINKDKQYNIVCSFYSPSGFENQKNYKYADYTCYLSFDTKKNAKHFIDTIKPDAAVVIRYDLWYNHISELNKRCIPLFLLCATKPKRSFPQSYYKKIYGFCDTIITMSQNDTHYFESLDLKTKILTSSDTRFDRIIDVVSKSKENPLFPKSLFKNEIVFIAGSCWLPDEKIISEAIEEFNKTGKQKIRAIYVPHEPSSKNIAKLQELVPNSILYSEIKQEKNIDEIGKLIASKAIIIDCIGVLLRLYANADIAYIGGGFGTGLHSVTEPAGYGIPLICGERYNNSPDAIKLVDNNILKPIKNLKELLSYLTDITINHTLRNDISRKASQYINKSKGSTDLAIKNINQILKK